MNQPLTNGAQFAHVEKIMAGLAESRRQIAADAIARELLGIRALAQGVRDLLSDPLAQVIEARCQSIEDALKFLAPASARSTADEWLSTLG